MVAILTIDGAHNLGSISVPRNRMLDSIALRHGTFTTTIFSLWISLIVSKDFSPNAQSRVPAVCHRAVLNVWWYEEMAAYCKRG